MINQKQSKVSMCMQCGICTASCPEAGITSLNIRMLVRKNQLNRGIEKLIPWFCTSCGECTLRCPRNVNPSEMIIDLRSGDGKRVASKGAIRNHNGGSIEIMIRLSPISSLHNYAHFIYNLGSMFPGPPHSGV